MADGTNTPTVNETAVPPACPSDVARRNSLEHYLQNRPGREELVQRNILLASNAAPGLQAQQKELEKSMRANSLNEKIAHRPSPEDLIRKGVLDEDPRSADEKYEEAITDEYAKREGGA